MHSLESTSEENDQNAFGHFKISRLPELPTLPDMHSLESTSEENDQNAFDHFKYSRLPEFLRGSTENAKKIINLGGIGPHPPVL